MTATCLSRWIFALACVLAPGFAGNARPADATPKSGFAAPATKATNAPGPGAVDWSHERQTAARVRVRAAADKDIQELLAWNNNTLAAAYEKVGTRKASWDEPARKALEEYARVRADSGTGLLGSVATLDTHIAQAMKAGCTDPLLGYLNVCFILSVQPDVTPKRLLDAMNTANRRLQQSQYHSVRKFYSALRAAEVIRSTTEKTNLPPAHKQLLQDSIDQIHLAVRDKSLPTPELFDAWEEIHRTMRGNKLALEGAYRVIKGDLEELDRTNSAYCFIKGSFHVEHATTARGGVPADQVTEEAWKFYYDRLQIAADSLNAAWRLDPGIAAIPTEMIRVELGQGLGRDRMELWFARAMELDPNNAPACHNKLTYLEPLSRGSIEAMLAFGRECATSTRWGGEVPLSLYRAHVTISKYMEKAQRKTYWTRPGVWADLKTSFEKYLSAKDADPVWRYDYADYAYLCEQWGEFLTQVSLLRDINHEFFGGKKEFDEMMSTARQRAGR